MYWQAQGKASSQAPPWPRAAAHPADPAHWELWFDFPAVLEHSGDEQFRIWPLSILTNLVLALWTPPWISAGVTLCSLSPGTGLLQGHGQKPRGVINQQLF